jgi:predicted PurR-regulated permease PerM
MTISSLQRIALITIIAAGILAALIFGRGFLVPIVLSVLLYGLLTYAIVRLESLGTPTWLATTLSVGAGFVVLIAMGLIIQSQFGALEKAWPQYLERFETLLQQISALTGQDFVSRIQSAISQLDIGGLVTQLTSSAGSVFNEIILICLYTMFLLAERGILVGKLAHLVPSKRRRRRLEEGLSTVGRSVRQYLSIKTAVSGLTGLLTYAVAKAYGIHFAELTGLLAFLLNFIPVIGSAIAVVIPVVLALAQFETLSPTLQIAILLFIVQATVGNVIEPKLMGRGLNLSPVVVIVALTFWTTIWGIAGAFLSIPITAAVAIICRDIKPLRWIAVLLSVDGVPEAQEEAKPATLQFTWPFGSSHSESEELLSLRRELEAMKIEKEKSAKKAPTSRQRRTSSSQRSSRRSAKKSDSRS